MIDALLSVLAWLTATGALNAISRTNVFEVLCQRVPFLGAVRSVAEAVGFSPSQIGQWVRSAQALRQPSEPPVYLQPCAIPDCHASDRICSVELELQSISKALRNQTRTLAVVVASVAALSPYFVDLAQWSISQFHFVPALLSSLR